MSFRRISLIGALSVGLLLNACAFREEKGGEENIPSPTGSFLELQQSVLGDACIRCHNPARAENGLDLTSYAKAIAYPNLIVPGNAEASLLYQVVFTGDMPPRGPRLEDEAVALIRDWINLGANEGGLPIQEPPPPVDPPPVEPPGGGLPEPVIADYKYIYENILEPRCFRCHGGEEEEGFIDVSDYNGLLNHFIVENLIVVGDAEASLIYQVVVEPNPRLRMPPRGDALTEQETELIRSWINNGAPEEL